MLNGRWGGHTIVTLGDGGVEIVIAESVRERVRVIDGLRRPTVAVDDRLGGLGRRLVKSISRRMVGVGRVVEVVKLQVGDPFFTLELLLEELEMCGAIVRVVGVVVAEVDVPAATSRTD